MPRLVVIHYHYRTGGVRSVIASGLEALALQVRANELPPFEIVLAGGEAPDENWLFGLRQAVSPLRLNIAVWSGAGYLGEGDALSHSERCDALQKDIRRTLSAGDVLWFHNPSLCRNPVLNALLVDELERPDNALNGVWHHHDFWFDNRPSRVRDLVDAGFRDEADIARICFPAMSNISHVFINSEDYGVTKTIVGADASIELIRNGISTPQPVTTSETDSISMSQKIVEPQVVALCSMMGVEVGNYWLYPARIMRRKNMLEALSILMRHDPKSQLWITGDVSSRDEADYASQLRELEQSGFPIRLGLPSASMRNSVSMSQLYGSAKVAISSSIAEGFGLTFTESHLAGCDLVYRRLGHLRQDFIEQGLSLPYGYSSWPIAMNWLNSQGLWEEIITAWQKALYEQRYLAHTVGIDHVYSETDWTDLVELSKSTGWVDFPCLPIPVQIKVLHAQQRGDDPLYSSASAELAEYFRHGGKLQTARVPSPQRLPEIYSMREFGVSLATVLFTKNKVSATENSLSSKIQQGLIKLKCASAKACQMLDPG